MLSCTDSEVHDKCLEHGLDLSMSGMDKSSRTASPACLPRLEDKRDAASCRLLSSAPEPDYSSSTPHLCNDRYHLSRSSHCNHSGINGGRHSTLIDQESQTNFELRSSAEASTSEPCVLSKAYIVKTYSIQNATPSPSPKFPPANHSSQLPECILSSAVSADPACDHSRHKYFMFLCSCLFLSGFIQTCITSSPYQSKYQISKEQPLLYGQRELFMWEGLSYSTILSLWDLFHKFLCGKVCLIPPTLLKSSDLFLHSVYVCRSDLFLHFVIKESWSKTSLHRNCCHLQGAKCMPCQSKPTKCYIRVDCEGPFFKF